MTKEPDYHTPVLLKEAISFLDIKPGQKYIDATAGGGGITAAILERGGKVLAIDWDEEAVNYLISRKFAKADKLTLVRGNFSQIDEIGKRFGFGKVSGIVFDLGVSGHQLDKAERGFSFAKAGPLDMRMDKSLAVAAADLVNGLSENELFTIFKKFGEERYSRRIARGLVRARRIAKITNTTQLAEIVARSARRSSRVHPATRVFQALRIAVNDELGNLTRAIPAAVSLLVKSGRIVVISFHSLEDRIVKNFFKSSQALRFLTKKPVRPSLAEIMANPRARSAKLRAAVKL